jgi:hypothetical protein
MMMIYGSYVVAEAIFAKCMYHFKESPTPTPNVLFNREVEGVPLSATGNRAAGSPELESFTVDGLC